MQFCQQFNGPPIGEFQSLKENFLGDFPDHGNFRDVILFEGLNDFIQFCDVDIVVYIGFCCQFRFDIPDDGDDDDFVSQVLCSPHKLDRKFTDTGQESNFFHSNHPYS